MFEVTSESETPDHKSSTSPKKANRKPKAHSFSALTSTLQSWQPSDPSAMRRQLVNELIMLLDGKDFTCTRSCIPAIVVDKQYPVDLLHYQSSEDINEFVVRMLWMHQEFNSAIGILLGVPNEEIATEVEDAYCSLLSDEDDCVVLLL